MKNVLIVLGSRPLRNYKPSPCMISRVRKALSIYRKSNFQLVVLSGGGRGLSESMVMKVMLQNFIPAERMLVERKSKNTVQKAVFSWELLKDEEIKRIVVISSEFDLPFVRYVFRKLYAHMGVKLEFEPAPNGFDPIESAFRMVIESLRLFYVRIVGF